jgi:hypothetical protein
MANSWVHPTPNFYNVMISYPQNEDTAETKSETPNSVLFKCKHTRNLHQQHIFESTPLLHKPQERTQNADENLNSLLRASPAVLSMWSCTGKIDEENPTYAGLTQENGFGSA